MAPNNVFHVRYSFCPITLSVCITKNIFKILIGIPDEEMLKLSKHQDPLLFSLLLPSLSDSYKHLVNPSEKIYKTSGYGIAPLLLIEVKLSGGVCVSN